MNNMQLHYLSSILSGKREITEEEAHLRAEHLKLSALVSPFLVAEIAPYYTGIRAEEKDELIQACANYVRYLLTRADFSAYYYINEFDNVQVLFLGTTSDVEDKLEEILIDIRNKIQNRFELDSFIGMGSVVNSITAISVSANEAAEMLAYKFSYAEQGVVNIKNLIRFSHSPNFASNIRFDRVIGCFQDGNIGKMAVRLGELIEELRNRPNASKTSIRRTFIELTVSVLHVAANADVDTYEVVKGLDIYQWILEQQHTEILFDWFVKLCEELHTKMQAQIESSERSIIQNACTYIDDHIDRQDLSLQDVSRSVGLSTYYFSKLFKKEKGLGLNNYITYVRLDQAKQMLVNTSFTVGDIAAQCGFSTAQYFSLVFKKNVGVTPSEFRRQDAKNL